MNARSWLPLIAAVVAAVLPLGAIFPHATFEHVAMVPSFDVTRPCVAPHESAMRLHAVLPFVMIRVLLPLAIVIGIGRERAAPNARYLLGFAFALSATVLLFTASRTLRGGFHADEVQTCGALTPESGADAAHVRALPIVRTGRQQLIEWRDLPRLPRPPWVHGEIAVTIAGDPWTLRVRSNAGSSGIVAEPDDLRRADRPLPALHFASVPSMVVGPAGSFLLDHRPLGKLYAVRVGSPVDLRQIGPLVSPPRWPLLMLVVALAGSLATLIASRPARVLAAVFSPYRTAMLLPAPESPLVAWCALVLIEASATAIHVLLPYL